MEQERIAKLEAQVESIKDDVKEVKDDIKEIHSRITTGNREIVEKMDDMQTRLEHKMTASALASKDQHDAIQKALKEDLKASSTELGSELKKVSDRVDVLERWRFMIVGGALALGYLVSHLELFSKILGK